MKKIFFILLFFISSCGYQPLYQNKDIENFKFRKITLTGDNYINKRVTNTISVQEDNEAKNEKELFISSSTEIQETSKNSKGQVEYFRIIVTVNLKIINKINGNIQSKNFVKEFTYNNKQNKFELIEYQNFIKDELIDKIINDIIVYLNS
jgi:outer membrane lipopolysaccharide assembly protein LptE/RlpB